MEEAYKTAAKVSEKVAAKNKEGYDKKASASELQSDDRVLVRNLREKGGPGKLRSYYEEAIYKVLERRGDSPVYVVQPEEGGEVRVLHRNHLLPVGEGLVPKKKETPKVKTTRNTHTPKPVVSEVKEQRAQVRMTVMDSNR